MSFVVAELITLIITGVIVLIGVGILLGSMGISSLTEFYEPELLLTRLAALLPLLAGVSVAIVFFVIAGLVFVFLKTGLYGMAAESLRGKTKVDTMFKVARKRGIKGIITSILVGIIAFFLMMVLIVGLGIALPLVGSIIGLILFLLIMILFSLTFPGIIVDDLGVIETIETSFNIVKKNYFETFGLLLFYGIISVVIVWIPILGLLVIGFVIVPMVKISLVYFYKKNK